MKNKDLLSIRDLEKDEIEEILALTAKLKKSPLLKKRSMKHKTLALVFQKPSNRTRISFEVAMTHLGGYTMYLSPWEINMGVRESPKDVGCVLSRYVDCIVARVFSHESIKTLAHYADVPVINGLSDMEHPCQSLSDIFTVKEKFKTFKGVTLTYVGDGNNVLNSLMIASAKVGLNIRYATPVGYEPDSAIIEEAKVEAEKNSSTVEGFNDPVKAVDGADVIYTDVWTSMGQEDEAAKRIKDFEGFQVNEALVSKTGKNTFLMHCLPAHRGEEVDNIIDGKNSIIYDQAENRMHVEKAILYMLMSGK